MRSLLVAVGTYGDVLPILALGVELKRRGHEVAVAAPPPFAGMASRAGLPFQPLGTTEDYERFISTQALWRPLRGIKPLFTFVTALVEPVYRWLEAEYRPGSDIVVASTLSLGARVAQDALDLTLITVHVMPFLVESRFAPPRLPGLPLPRWLPPDIRHRIALSADKYVIGPAALPRLNAFRAAIGEGPVRRLRYWWNSRQRVILMFPDWFAAPQADWPAQARQVGFPQADHLGANPDLDADLESFLAEGEAPLAFTYGSAMRQAGAFFRTAVAICARLGRRGILIAPEDGQVPGKLPPNVMHVRYAPFSALLPRCAALVHHGGVGTVAQALAAGVPQLIVPVAFDHFDEARRVVDLGVGTTLSRRHFTSRRAARLLRDLLADPAIARACAITCERAVGDDGVIAACDVIEEFLRLPVA
jgi:rhamnosyltransferase subunit B